jgi:hypothetical protein
MAAHAGLPDLNTLEVFSYYDPDPDAMIDIISDDDTHPRIIEDYVIDPIDCEYSAMPYRRLIRLVTSWTRIFTSTNTI